MSPLGSRPRDNLTGQDLGGLTLTPGVYFFSSSAQLTGDIDAELRGRPERRLRLPDWQHVDDSQRLGHQVYQRRQRRRSLLAGRQLRDPRDHHPVRLARLSRKPVSRSTTGANIACGRAIALTAAVTMDANNVGIGGCNSPPGGSSRRAPIPEPSTWAMMLLGFAGLGFAGYRRTTRQSPLAI